MSKLSIKISGEVVHGDKIGRKIGFPTANIYPKILQKLEIGIYAGLAFLDQKTYQAAIYIGKKPTFESSDLKVEVHILDFNQDIYGQNLKVEILEFIRGDQKFDSVEKLKIQIAKDCQKIREILENQKFNPKTLKLTN
jgi:riboflavin kinase / FMN adenylyltransferase